MKVFNASKIFIPKKSIDMNKWAVIACDQHTSEEEYWNSLKQIIGNCPSTLNLILPEVYLEVNNQRMIKQINENMEKYLQKEYFEEVEGLILVKRTVNNKTRYGIVGQCDLESYEYTDTKAIIKATEQTVIERIPPRLEIRRNAILELPHTIVLLNDINNIIFKEVLKSNEESLNNGDFKLLYDFDLNMDGGHISGYKISNYQEIVHLINEFLNNASSQVLAVGDGNHSLATAKEHWNNLKTTFTQEQINEGILERHPARFSLIEIENIYDDGIEFSGIHRLVENYNEDFIEKLKTTFNKDKYKVPTTVFLKEEEFTIYIPTSTITAIIELQKFLDDEQSIKIDYIHGISNLKKLCVQKNGIGIVFPTINKEELFKYVSDKGSLPRKSFSMGEANDKRYYIECRKIIF